MKMWKKDAVSSFDCYIKPFLSRHPDIDCTRTMDFACGRGRIAELFTTAAKSIILCDVNVDAIEYCKKRFKDFRQNEFAFVVTKTEGIRPLALPLDASSVSFIYSWDAMVHFDYRWLDFYISEFARVLQHGGHALVHHSNLGGDDCSACKNEYWAGNPGSRALVSKNDVRFIAEKNKFVVEEQVLIDWGVQNLDCITLLKRCFE